MVYPALIPVVVAPHLLVPAAIMYILHLDQQETVARVRQCQAERRAFLERIPPAPPLPEVLPSYDMPPAYEIDGGKRDTMYSERLFDEELYDRVLARTLRYRRMNESPMRNYIRLIGSRPFKRRQRVRDMQTYCRVLNPLYMFTSSQELGQQRSKLCRVSMLTDAYTEQSSLKSGYNCHSPMQQFVAGEYNRNDLICNAIYVRYRISTRQPKETPMRELCHSDEFCDELRDTCQDYADHRFSRTLWRAVFHRMIAPKIPAQQGIVLSHMRRCMQENVWFAIMEYNDQIDRYHRFTSSPMRKMAQSPYFQACLEAYQQQKRDATRQRTRDHMWWVTLIEGPNIKALAAKKRFNRMVKASPLYRWTRNNKLELATSNTERSARRVLEYASPLRLFTCENHEPLQQAARDMYCLRYNQQVYRDWIGDDLRKNYGTLYRKHAMRAYRIENNIPEVTFDENCSNTAFIVFTPNKHLANQFLADSNLEDFRSTTVYWNKNNFQSYAYSHLGRGVCINDLTDAAQTFLNISHLTDENTQVQMHADTGKMNIPEGGTTHRHIWIYFVKRDLTEFKADQFKTCSTKVRDYFRRMKDADVDVRVGCVDKWLSGTLVVRIESLNDADIPFENISKDIINMVNLVKGVIYAKMSDRIGWIHLPPIQA